MLKPKHTDEASSELNPAVAEAASQSRRSTNQHTTNCPYLRAPHQRAERAV
jgi:hypothetical protein